MDVRRIARPGFWLILAALLVMFTLMVAWGLLTGERAFRTWSVAFGLLFVALGVHLMIFRADLAEHARNLRRWGFADVLQRPATVGIAGVTILAFGLATVVSRLWGEMRK